MASNGSGSRSGKRVSVVSRIVVSLVILGISVGIFRTLVALKPPAPKAERPPAALNVRVITAQPVSTARVWVGYGTALAKEAADVAAEVAATVVSRPADAEVGRWIDTGETIATLDAREYADRAARSRELAAALEAEIDALDIELESSQESLRLIEQSAELTRKELERIRGAIEAGSASRFEIEAVEDRLARVLRERETVQRELNLWPTRKARLKAQLDAERASQRLAELDVSRSTVAAPFSGVIQAVDVEVGERVTIGERVARVVDLGVIEVPLRVPVASAKWMRVGSRAVVDLGTRTAGVWEGRVVRIAPEADPATRTLTVFVEIEQRGAVAQAAAAGPGVETLLLPGQFVFGRIESATPIERIVVPRTAVIGDRVFVVDAEGVVRSREVDVEFSAEGRHPEVHPDETQWYILERGVEPGDRVAVSNVAELRAGMHVTPTPVGSALAGDGAP